MTREETQFYLTEVLGIDASRADDLLRDVDGRDGFTSFTPFVGKWPMQVALARIPSHQSHRLRTMEYQVTVK